MKTFTGIIKGINIKSKYFFLETIEKVMIKCFYKYEDFKYNFKISDLRVNEDIITVKGKICLNECNCIFDIEDITRVDFDIDYDDEDVIKELTTEGLFTLDELDKEDSS